MSMFRILLPPLWSPPDRRGPALAAGRADRVPAARQSDQQRPSRDADRAFRATQQGRSMPLPQLERRVMPLMGGADYLGPEFNGDTYRLKFMQNGRVIWVDVDGQSGRIIRRSRD